MTIYLFQQQQRIHTQTKGNVLLLYHNKIIRCTSYWKRGERYQRDIWTFKSKISQRLCFISFVSFFSGRPLDISFWKGKGRCLFFWLDYNSFTSVALHDFLYHYVTVPKNIFHFFSKLIPTFRFANIFFFYFFLKKLYIFSSHQCSLGQDIKFLKHPRPYRNHMVSSLIPLKRKKEKLFWRRLRKGILQLHDLWKKKDNMAVRP